MPETNEEINRIIHTEIMGYSLEWVYRDSGMRDINQKPIMEGSIINADGYCSDLEHKHFHCVVADKDGRFYSDIYGDSDPLSSYRTIEVVGHAEDYRDLYGNGGFNGGWSGNLGEGLTSTPPVPDYCSDSSPRSLLNEVVAKVREKVLYDNLLGELEMSVLSLDATAEQIARACVKAWRTK